MQTTCNEFFGWSILYYLPSKRKSYMYIAIYLLLVLMVYAPAVCNASQHLPISSEIPQVEHNNNSIQKKIIYINGGSSPNGVGKLA